MCGHLVGFVGNKRDQAKTTDSLPGNHAEDFGSAQKLWKTPPHYRLTIAKFCFTFLPNISEHIEMLQNRIETKLSAKNVRECS